MSFILCDSSLSILRPVNIPDKECMFCLIVSILSQTRDTAAFLSSEPDAEADAESDAEADAEADHGLTVT